MTQSGDTKHNAELQKAFAELKDSLRHAVDPVNDQAPKLGGAVLEAPPAATVRPAAPTLSGAPPEVRETRLPQLKTAVAAEAGRRRKLLYLSAAVVIFGLAALGWTLTRGNGTNNPEIEASAEPETDVVETPAAAPDGAEASSPTETATTETETPPSETARAESAPPPSAAPESAAAPQSPAPAETVAATPNRSDEPPQAAPNAASTSESAPVPAGAQRAAGPLAAPAATAPAPTSAPAKQAALSPTTTAPDADAAKPTAAKPKPARPKAVAKPKPANQAARRPATGSADAAPPPPAPVAAAAPPPPPAQSDGAFGFVKRTVNSVGSTLTNLGGGASGN